MKCLELKSNCFEQIQETEIDELKLFFDNDEQLYRSRYVPFLKNYTRKMKKGNYDKDLAIKGIKNNLVNDIIKSYDGIELRDINMESRKELAKQIVEDIERIVRIDYDSDYDKVLKDFS
jgi:hypothetical protein